MCALARPEAIAYRLACDSVNYEGATNSDTFVCYPEPVTVINADKMYYEIDWNDMNPQNGAWPFLKFKLIARVSCHSTRKRIYSPDRTRK
jgi:hypothetical protein